MAISALASIVSTTIFGSISPSLPFIELWVMAGAYPSCPGSRLGVDPGQVATVFTVNLTCMSSGCGRKPK